MHIEVPLRDKFRWKGDEASLLSIQEGTTKRKEVQQFKETQS